MTPSGNLHLIPKDFVPVLQLRLHARDGQPVRQLPGEPRAGFFSGLVAVKAEIAARLPVLREQVDKGYEVNRRFKHAELIPHFLIAESVRLFRFRNVQTKPVRCSPTVCVSLQFLQIPPE